MATKLKTLVRSSLTQTVVKIILTILVLVVSLSFLFIGHYEDLYYSGLYESEDFSYEFQRRVHNVIEKELVLKSTEAIEKMAAENQSYDYNDLISRWYQIQSNLLDASSFRYYIENNSTGEQYSNLSALKNKESLSDYAFRLTIDRNKIEATEIRNGKIIYLESYSRSTILDNAKAIGNWEGVFVLQVPVESNDVFKELTDQYKAIVPFLESRSSLYAGIMGVIILGIFLFIYLVISAIKSQNSKKSISDHIPNDIKSVMILGSFPIMIEVLEFFTFDPFIMVAHQREQWIEIANIAMVFLWVFIGLQFTLSLIRALSEGSLLKNTMVYMIFQKGFQGVTRILKRLSRSKTFRRRVIVYAFVYGFGNYVLGMIFALDYEILSLFLWILFNALCFYLVYRNLQSLQIIMRYVSDGDVSEPMESESISPLFYNFANQINGLQQNLKKAIQEAIKGERLKTELITNVSHDLKTPLTAIVNYTSLLKNKEIEDAETVKYIQVIDEKAGVLKRLIDDVLEVSKVSSGNVEINMEVLDINQLIQQVLGEFEEELKNHRLNLITTELTVPLYVEADSLKLWRVVQNLVSNIAKYALPDSRVFILVKNTDKHAVAEFKNISKDMLLTGNNELMERFVRGDVSRTQEGFGLGLAIAGDLMKLQKGRLDIVVDGDLFKVTLVLNVCENSQKDV
ncbi:sensor histidine kinase KdpD [Fusibacter sp. 3D3]|uniref:sensor histidine kinase n=1 Tax=Fusibacter sp. 3D3 TaxID=1048380 RepID=UPI000852B8CE|nr:HAMP domain-containing sensor histidine kinase [Fusibacter sp. 3D3]GAU75513.1 two-component sensor histidine kinase [Fusibacter sp. 3D3]